MTGATDAVASKLAGLGLKDGMAALDARIPAPARAFLGGPAPSEPASIAGLGTGADTVPRSVKSRALVSEETMLRNAALPNRELRVGAAMAQLGVERPFAEKVADAHERVPCEVGRCTPEELRAKMEIMGPGPSSALAIRSGLAGGTPKPAGGAPALDAAPNAAPLDWSGRELGARFDSHILKAELTEEQPIAYNPRRIKGGGHTGGAIAGAFNDISRSAVDARARYAADQRTLAELARQQDAGVPLRGARAKEFESVKKRLDRQAKPPEPGEHWTEAAAPIVRLPELENGVQRVLLPREAFDAGAWKKMESLANKNTDPEAGYVAGGKTLFPENWTDAEIAEGIQSVKSRPLSTIAATDGRKTLYGTATHHGRTVRIEVGLDPSGKITTGFPTWRQ